MLGRGERGGGVRKVVENCGLEGGEFKRYTSKGGRGSFE